MSACKFHLLLLFCFCQLSFQAQDTYKVGVASESLKPGDESLSLALAGYAGPWAGRFILNWTEKGKISENSFLNSASAKIPKLFRKPLQSENFLHTEVYNDTVYGLNKNGVIKRAVATRKKISWNSFPALADAKTFVLYNHYFYAATGSDTLWKMNAHDPASGWHKAGYYNGQIKKVNISKLWVHQNKLYAANASDSLFEARKNIGKGEEEIYSRAIAIEKNNKKVLMVCLDLCGFNYNFANEIKEELSRKNGIPTSAILINASHTHFVPGTQAWLTWAPHNRVPDSNYLYKVVKPAILKSAQKALSEMYPSNIHFGRGSTTIGRNRSNAGSEGPYDSDVDVIKVTGLDGKHNAVMVLSGCHPVYGTKGIAHYTVSSNFPGYMRSFLEKSDRKLGTALFMQGCAGDINPRDEPDVSGTKLASDALKVLNENMQPLTGDITFNFDSLALPTDPWPKEKIIQFRAENLKLGAEMVAERNVAWSDLMLKNIEKGTTPQFMSVYIHTINIGNWKLVGVSRETVTQYSIDIKKIWPGKLVSVAGYCNDVSSYLPEARHIRTDVYEGVGSFFWYGQPSTFPMDVLDRIVNHIRSKNY